MFFHAFWRFIMTCAIAFLASQTWRGTKRHWQVRSWFNVAIDLALLALFVWVELLVLSDLVFTS